MTQDTRSPGILDHALPELPVRCADSARMRGEPLQASAVRYRRFLLLEVPGPWGRSALEGKHLDPGIARRLGQAAAAADTHVVLIRRPGRHAAADARVRAWALADTAPGAERVLWGAWRDPADLLDLDLSAPVPGDSNAAGPRRLALVCTNGKRDQCCAIRGRPVAAEVASGTDWDTWECSHLGGHRFAATMMLLPTGDMFGRLDPESALEVLRRFDAGQLVMAHYRGRSGQPVPAQAALHAAAVRLGDFGRAALRVSRVRPDPAAPDLWEAEVIHRPETTQETAYRITLAASHPAPTPLSCNDSTPKAEPRYAPLSFSRA